MPHVRNHPNLADSIWQMLLHFLPLDGVGLAVTEGVKLLSKPKENSYFRRLRVRIIHREGLVTLRL